MSKLVFNLSGGRQFRKLMFSLPVSLDATRRDLSARAVASKATLGLRRRLFRSPVRPAILGEAEFASGLRLEQRRQERSGRPFLLVKVTAPGLFGGVSSSPPAKRMVRLLASAARQTDTIGWLEAGKVLGVLCTELGDHSESSAGEAILEKIGKIAKKAATHEASAILSLEIYSSPSMTSGEAQGRRAQMVS